MRQSAGILLYRHHAAQLQVFLVHPGGPFWKNKDLGAWSVPKGEFTDEEDALAAAKREFEEETGQTIDGEFTELKPVRYKNGKVIHCWAVKGSADETNIKSNYITVEFPYRSGKMISIPEVDKAGWFDPETAKTKIIPAQADLVVQLEEMVLK